MKTVKKVRVKKPARVWAFGETVSAGTVAYKAVRGGAKNDDWYILKCTVAANGVALKWNDKHRVKFKVPSVVVDRAWKVEGGVCTKCNHHRSKFTVYTDKKTFVADYNRYYKESRFRYTVGKLSVVKDYTNGEFCGKGIHLFPTRAGALDYAD